MTKSTSGKREKSAARGPGPLPSDEISALKTPAQTSVAPSPETCRGSANVVYIDPPTIPAGMTVETYRRARARRKPRGIRRLASPDLWLGSIS